MSADAKKLCVGDGVSVELDPAGYLSLTATDGIRVTNQIYLTPEVWRELKTAVDELTRQAEEDR